MLRNERLAEQYASPETCNWGPRLMIYKNHLCSFVLMTALLSQVVGCDSDSLSSGTVFLTHEFSEDVQGEAIRFSFSSDELQTNRLHDLSCECDLNIDEFITAQGFQPSDIVTAKLVSAEIIMLFPISERLDFLNQAILKLTGQGISPTEVASLSTLPSAREASMSVLPNRDIATFLERSSFGAILQIDPSSLESGETYDMSIILKVRLELDSLN